MDGRGCATSITLKALFGVFVAGLFVALPSAASAAAQSSFTLEEASIADVERAIQTKQVTATELVSTYLYDRATLRGSDGSKKPGELMGPKAIALPVSIDFLGRKFSEPVLIRIAAAYEQATHHRRPPKDFPRLAGEP